MENFITLFTTKAICILNSFRWIIPGDCSPAIVIIIKVTFFNFRHFTSPNNNYVSNLVTLQLIVKY